LSQSSDFDPFEDDLEQFHPSTYSGGARRAKKRPPKRRRTADVISERVSVAGRLGVQEGGRTTYRPSQFEEGWLKSSLQDFFEQELITDILMRVKGGKEATVYLCAGGVASDRELVAAKVYRPQRFRNLSNDQLYRTGRDVITTDGRELKKHDERIDRALHKRTDFGVQVRHTSWLMHEYNTMERLWEAGARVPEPLSSTDNAILMEYIGDRDYAAPTLREVRLDRDEAKPIFEAVMGDITLMLQWGIIHGDLSSYNVLYWDGQPTLIDFPQIVDPHQNEVAFDIFTRDVTRICEYFSKYGITADGPVVAANLWTRYVTEDVADKAADSSTAAAHAKLYRDEEEEFYDA
jgi:RIO kinase 1